MNVVDEIGNNSLYHAYPELHDIGRVEMLTLPIPPVPRNSISELPQSPNSVNSQSEKRVKSSKNEIDNLQAAISRRQRTRSSNFDDKNSSRNWSSQYRVTKTRRRPSLSHTTLSPSLPRRKQSSGIYQGFIHSMQLLANSSETSPSKPSAHQDLAVSLHSRLGLTLRDSAGSTYADIIDYYIHDLPANEDANG